jgi:PD-(D/E)XK nuclease superfamily
LAIRAALQLVFQTHQTGYGSEVTTKLLLTALRLQGLPVEERPSASATFRGIVVHESPLDCLLIDSRMILTLTSLFDDNSYAKSLGISCMKTLELPWGVAVNFGRTDLQITALRNSAVISAVISLLKDTP